MTLAELSREYEYSAKLLRERISELQKLKKSTDDEDEKAQLQVRIAPLSNMLKDTNKLAELTARYYDPAFPLRGPFTSTGPSSMIDSATGRMRAVAREAMVSAAGEAVGGLPVEAKAPDSSELQIYKVRKSTRRNKND